MSAMTPSRATIYNLNVAELDLHEKDVDSRKERSLVLTRDVVPDAYTIGPKRFATVFRVISRSYDVLHTSKWLKTYFWRVHFAKTYGQLTHSQSNSLLWVALKYAQSEADSDARELKQGTEYMKKKLMSIKLAVQCISGIKVLKYGRKGAPHKTTIKVQDLNQITWAQKIPTMPWSKYMANAGPLSKYMSKPVQKKGIEISSITEIRLGRTTKVFQRAASATSENHCFSLITSDRTLDLQAPSPMHRDWLVTSFQSLLKDTPEVAKAAAEDVEFNIMQRLSRMTIYKHGRKGKPHITSLEISLEGRLYWKGKPFTNFVATASSKFLKSIYLGDVKAVVPGKTTEVFRREKTKACDKLCLSLITTERTLDLQMATAEDREWVVVALRYVIEKAKVRHSKQTCQSFQYKKSRTRRHRRLNSTHHSERHIERPCANLPRAKSVGRLPEANFNPDIYPIRSRKEYIVCP